MQVRNTPLQINQGGDSVTIAVGVGGSGVYYGPYREHDTLKAQGTVAAPGSTFSITTPTWVLSQGDRDGAPADVQIVADSPPSSAGSGSVAPLIVQAGNLGATRSQALSATQETWLIGTLTANLTLTLTGLAAGARCKLLLTQDATGGRTLTLSDGTSNQAVGIASAAGTPTVLDIEYDGTNVYVVVPGLKGDPGPAGAASTVPGPPGPIGTVQDEGVDLTARSKLNFTGAGVTAADDAVNGRTNVVVTAGALSDNSVKVRHATPLLRGRGWLPTGYVAHNMPRATAGSRTAGTPITAGTLLLVGGLVLPGGVPVSHITFIAGNTSPVSPTNQWFCLVDQAGNVLGVTNDDTTAAWAGDAPKTLNLAVTYTPADDIEVYAGLAFNGTTAPTMTGAGLTKGVVSGLSPPVLATGGAITTPGALGATVTVTAVATTTPVLPYVAVS